MSTAENAAPQVRPEGDSTKGHFLEGFFFVAVPDVSDEAVHTINAGRAMPAFFGILRALRRQETKGRTEDARADARLGRLTIGINALARANGMTDAALRRQLVYLCRVGIIVMHTGERDPERDPETGRIVKGRGRTPPKVIVMNLTRDLMRPTREPRQTPQKPSQRPEEIPSNQSLRGSSFRDRNRPPSKDADLQRGLHPSDADRRRLPTGPGRPSAPPSPAREGGPAVGRPGEDRHQAFNRQLRQEAHEVRCENIGHLLGMSAQEVHLAGRADPVALRARVEAAGGHWETGRRLSSAPPRSAVLDARRAVGEAIGIKADSQESEEDRRRRMYRELDAAMERDLAAQALRQKRNGS
jgi:hypothetical protein